MKGMSQTLYLVVAAMVIMVTAIIVLAIFLQGTGPAVGLIEANSICQTQFIAACTVYGTQPVNWNIANVNIKEDGENVKRSCSSIITCTCLDKQVNCLQGVD